MASTPDLPIVRVPSEVVILRAGDASAPLFLVTGGSVQLSLLVEGVARPLLRVGPGEFFGSPAPGAGAVSALQAQAVGEATLVRLERGLLAEIYAARPEIAVHLLAQLHQRLESALARLVVAETSVGEPARPPSMSPPTTGNRPRAARRSAPEPLPALPPTTSLNLVHAESRTVIELVPGSPLLLGRADPGSGSHPDIDLGRFGQGHTVSRRHARLEARGSGFVLREEPRVANGTWVNGRRLVAGHEATLAAGDELTLGAVKLLVVAR
jgi:hypothetical protein